MKTSVKITLLLIVTLSLGMGRLSASDEYSRVIKKEYPVNADAQLVISNQYGKVHCNNWDKPSISFEIVLRTEASSEQAAQKILNQITIAMTGSPSLVDVRTTIEKGGFSGRSNVNIDYTVNMPASVSLDLTNKFGDIYINELNGKGKINLSYGNMEINKLNNSDNLVDVKFGKADIKSVKGAVVLLKYSDFEIDYAGSLRLDSKFTDIRANQIISLNASMEGGEMNLEKSGAVDTRSKFSDIEIGRIENTLELNIQYGNCEVHEMPSDFSNITITNKYADVSIGLPSGVSYVLEADLKFCDLDFPEDDANFSQKITGNTSKSYKAIVGKDAKPSGHVIVKSEFGNISLE